MAFRWIFLLPSLAFQVQMEISGSRVTVSAGPRPKQLPSRRILPSAPTTSVLKLLTVITECMPTVQSHPETETSRMHSLMSPNVGSRRWNSPHMQLLRSNGSDWKPSIADIFQDPTSTSDSGKRLFTTWSAKGSVPDNNVGGSVPRSVFLRSKANSDAPNTGNGVFESMLSANPIFQANRAMTSAGDTGSTFPANHHLPQTGTSSFMSWSADGPPSGIGQTFQFSDSMNGPDSMNLNNAWTSSSRNSPHSGAVKTVLLSGNVNNSTDPTLQNLFQGVPSIDNVSNDGTTVFKSWSSGHHFSNGNSHSVPSQVFYKVSPNKKVPNVDQPTFTSWSSKDSKTKQNVENSPFGNLFPPFEHLNAGTKIKHGQEENNNINNNASIETLQPFPYTAYQTNRDFNNSAHDTFQTMFDKLMSPSAVPESSEHFINMPESIRKRFEEKRSKQSKSNETHPPQIAHPFQQFQPGRNLANTNRRNDISQVNDVDRIFEKNPLTDFKRTHLKSSSLEIQDKLKAMVTGWVRNLTAEAKQNQNKLNTTTGGTEPSSVNNTNKHAQRVRAPTNTKKDSTISENNLTDFTFKPSIDTFKEREVQNRNKPSEKRLLKVVEPTIFKSDSSSAENSISKRKTNNVIKTQRQSSDIKSSAENTVIKRPEKTSSKELDNKSLNEIKVTPDVKNSSRKRKVNNKNIKTFPPSKAKRTKESRKENRSNQSPRNILNNQKESLLSKAGKQIAKLKDNRKDITELLPNPLLGKRIIKNNRNIPRPSKETEVHETLPADEKRRKLGKYLKGKHQNVLNTTKQTDKPKLSDKKQNSKANTKSKDTPINMKTLTRESIQNEHDKGNKSKFPKINNATPGNITNFIEQQTDQEIGTRQNSFTEDIKMTKTMPDTLQNETQNPQLTNKSKENEGGHRNTTNVITVKSQNGENGNQTIDIITTTSTARNTSDLTLEAKIKGNKILKSNISKTNIELFKNITTLLPEETNGTEYNEHDSTPITTTKEKHRNTTRLHRVKVETIDHRNQTHNISITTNATTINKTNVLAVTKEKGHKTLESNISTVSIELSTNTTHILPEQANNTERNSTQETITNEKNQNIPITTKTTSTIVNTTDLLEITKENIHDTIKSNISPITVENLGNSTITLQEHGKGANYNDQNSSGFTTIKGKHPITNQLLPQSVSQNGKERNSVSSDSSDINSIKDSKSNARYSNKLPQSKADQDSKQILSVFKTSTETFVNTNKGNFNKTLDSITTTSPIISALLKPNVETNNDKQKSGGRILLNDTVMNMQTTEKELASIIQTKQNNTENKQNISASSTGSSNNLIHNYKTEQNLKPELLKDIGYKDYTTMSTITSTFKDPPPIIIKYTKDTTNKDGAQYTTLKAKNVPLRTDFKMDVKKKERYGITTARKGETTPEIFHLPPPPPIIFNKRTTTGPPVDPSTSYLFPEEKQNHPKDVKKTKAVHLSSLEPVKNTTDLVPILSTDTFKVEGKKKLKHPAQSVILPTQSELKHKKQTSDVSNIGNSVVKSNMYDIYDVATPVKNVRQPNIPAVDKKPTPEVDSIKLLEKLLSESKGNSFQLFSVPKSRYRKQRPKTVRTSKSSDNKRRSYTKDKDISNSKPSYGKQDKKSVPISILEMVYFGVPGRKNKKDLTPQLTKQGNMKLPKKKTVNSALKEETSTSPTYNLVPSTHKTQNIRGLKNNRLQKVLYPDTKAKRNSFELTHTKPRPIAKETVAIDYVQKPQTGIQNPPYQMGKIKDETRNGINILNSLLSGKMRRGNNVQLFPVSSTAYEENIANVPWKRGAISVTERPPVAKLVNSNQKAVNNADLGARRTNSPFRDRNVGQLKSEQKSGTNLQGPVVKTGSNTMKQPLIDEHSMRQRKTTYRSPNDWFRDFNIMSGDVGNRRKTNNRVNLFGNYKNEQPVFGNYETTYRGSPHVNLIQPENSAFMMRQNVNHITESRPNDVLRKKDLYHHNTKKASNTPVINLWDFVSHFNERPILPESPASLTTHKKTASVNTPDTPLSDGHKNAKNIFPTNVPKTDSIKSRLFPPSF